MTNIAPIYKGPCKETHISFLYIFFLIIILVLFLLFIETVSAFLSQTPRRTMGRAHIFADNCCCALHLVKMFLLCIDCSTAKWLKAEYLPFYCYFFGTILEKDKLMSEFLCAYTANAQISMLQLFSCDIVCVHSKCKYLCSAGYFRKPFFLICFGDIVFQNVSNIEGVVV